MDARRSAARRKKRSAQPCSAVLLDEQSRPGLLEAILDSLPLGIAVVYGVEHRYLLTNPAYRQLLGRASATLDGARVDEVLSAAAAERIVPSLAEVYRTGKPCHLAEHEVALGSAAAAGCFSHDLLPLSIQGPSVDAVLLTTTDVSQQVRARRCAEQASTARDCSVAMVAHELRNLLAALQGGVDVLQRVVQQDGPASRAARIIERNVKLQTRLVNDLLDLSRVSQGKLQLQRAPVSLDEVVRAALQLSRAEAEHAGVRLVYHHRPEKLWVNGDFDRLQQVIVNLLSNSIKFTPAGGQVTVRVFAMQGSAPAEPETALDSTTGPVRVPVAGTACLPLAGGGERGAADMVSVQVQDTGIGMEESLLGRLFEMFAQGEVGSGQKAGLGIGLALAKSLVERHGGRIWAESKGLGKGSMFTVELPRCAPPREKPEARTADTKRTRPRVLVVVGDGDTRVLIAESLELMGYDVLATATAEETLELLGKAPTEVDLIVAKLDLPGMDGCELLRQARRLPGLQHLAGLAITAYGWTEDVRRARAAGYAGHFDEPVDLAGLDRQIRRLLGGCS